MTERTTRAFLRCPWPTAKLCKLGARLLSLLRTATLAILFRVPRIPSLMRIIAVQPLEGGYHLHGKAYLGTMAVLEAKALPRVAMPGGTLRAGGHHMRDLPCTFSRMLVSEIVFPGHSLRIDPGCFLLASLRLVDGLPCKPKAEEIQRHCAR